MLRNIIVNLTTKNRILENSMLAEYPEPLFECQIEKRGSGANKEFVFKNLDYSKLILFLYDFGGDFTICESETGRVIERNIRKTEIVYH
jgi:hypothetical protein|tara:strand:- start:1949 stop:2215 length:267 start_codon:yes stop_codon:yes gene_type:complete